MNQKFINALGIELLEQIKQDPKLTLSQLSEVDNAIYFNSTIYLRYLLKAETKTNSRHTMEVKIELYDYYDTKGFEVLISTLVSERNVYRRAEVIGKHNKGSEFIKLIATDILSKLHNVLVLYLTQT